MKILVIVVGLFFFTSNLSGSFLPIYFKNLGLTVAEIIEILLFTFIIIGLLPLALLRIVRNFERIISFGILFTLVFFVALVYIRSPILLGLAYGLGIATFWPSFNLLQYRLSESRMRARTVSLFSAVIPSLASIIGPAVGGFTIENFGFTSLFAISIILYLIAFLLSTQIRFKPETQQPSMPKSGILPVFFLTFIILGLIEAYWLAYPFFVLNVSGTILNMGLVLAASGVIMSAITYSVNWLSDIKRARIEFAIIGTTMNIAWYLLVAHSSTMHEIVGLSLLSGLASAFAISWFAFYGDCFPRHHHASILVLMEIGLMIGRILNLVPTYIFMSKGDYTSYFALLGTVAVLLIPLYVISRKRIPIKHLTEDQ